MYYFYLEIYYPDLNYIDCMSDTSYLDDELLFDYEEMFLPSLVE